MYCAFDKYLICASPGRQGELSEFNDALTLASTIALSRVLLMNRGHHTYSLPEE